MQNLLTDAGKGFFGNDYMRDYNHGSQTFVSDAYGYAPKFKFLFHVYFDVNESLITDAQPPNMPDDRNYGLAVKSVQLPKYSFDLHTLNQYNRKRIVQTKIKYDPVSIVMHDTNSNLATKLWHAYYTYYYKDGVQADPFAGKNQPNSKVNIDSGSGADINQRTIYDPSITGNDDWGYVGEPSTTGATYQKSSLGVTKPPFFRSINIYGFNQHNFILYRLINPVIQSFTHDTYDYAQAGGVMENTMTLEYETVKYYSGAVDGKTPSQVVANFGKAHYDSRISPIAQPGSNSSILGQGGLIDGAGGVLDDLESGNILGAVKKTGQLAKTFNNPQAILNAAKGDAMGAATDWLKGTPNRNNMFNFPMSSGDVANGVNSAITGGIRNATGINLGNAPPRVPL